MKGALVSLSDVGVTADPSVSVVSFAVVLAPFLMVELVVLNLALVFRLVVEDAITSHLVYCVGVLVLFLQYVLSLLMVRIGCFVPSATERCVFVH